MTIDQDKAALRDRLREVRHHISQHERNAAAQAICEHGETLMSRLARQVVSGFWPIRDEINITPLLIQLHEAGLTCALPIVETRQAPLVFRQWQPGDLLQKSSFGLHQPLAEATSVTPQILIVPLLAFDQEGMRLGWGGGYYDRTLAQLRVSSGVIAVGVGYSAQQVDKLPSGPHDQRLDYMMTPEGIIEFS